MEANEKKVRQEDCSEDTLGPGILTLTNKRIAFDKTRGRIMDFAKKIGDTVLDIPLNDVIKVWKEGIFMKKVCITAKTKSGEKDFKFGVLGTGGWLETIQDTLEEHKASS